MGLIYNNGVAGSGVSKKSPRKKPFKRFWEMFIRKFWILFQINMIYVLFCIPIVTIGPATAAMTALMRNIYLEKPQFVFHDFKEEFKKNFKQALPIGLLDLAALFMGNFVIYYYYVHHADMDVTAKVLMVLSLIASIFVIMMSFYIYPQIVALDLKLGAIVRNSILLVFLNPLGDIITLALFFGYAALIWWFLWPVLMLIPVLPFGWIAFVAVFTCYPTIQKVLINPYYEKTGEKNPEIPDYEEEAVFSDRGGDEAEIDLRKKEKTSVHRGGKIIK